MLINCNKTEIFGQNHKRGAEVLVLMGEEGLTVRRFCDKIKKNDLGDGDVAKKLYWEQETEGERHEVALTYSYLTGKAVVEIDGMSFDISTKPFALRGTNQAFRLGEEMAVLDFPR